jgi:hypothetical protein
MMIDQVETYVTRVNVATFVYCQKFLFDGVQILFVKARHSVSGIVNGKLLNRGRKREDLFLWLGSVLI